MKILLTGSMAFDTIAVFGDQFKNHILPEQTHILNVSFFTPEMRRYQGGCAGNMAYTLKMLGGEPIIMATVGDDFGPYRQRLQEIGLDQTHIKHIDGELTAQAFIINDADNNQINAFHPGAMNMAHHNKVGDALDIELGIVSPDGRDGMLQHAEQFNALGIPFFFDPGQGLPMFDGEELSHFMQLASYAIFNDYESHMMMDKTGLSLEQLAGMVDTLIVTKGAEGSQVINSSESIHIGCASIQQAVDPTGCGDAYRAGLLYGLSNGWSWKACAQLGALCGAIKIEQPGTQKHHFTQEELAARYLSEFGEQLPSS